jgi:DNA-binding transcriptional ArsR family regulator
LKHIEENALKAASFLKGLASHHRLLILCQLAEGEKSVSELIEATSMPQTSMSQHLSKLKEEGIVTFRRDHRTLYYSINNDDVLKIMDVLYHKFCEKL